MVLFFSVHSVSSFGKFLLLAFGRGKKMSEGLARQDFVAGKYYPKHSGGVEILQFKPEGLGLAWRSGLSLLIQKPKIRCISVMKLLSTNVIIITVALPSRFPVKPFDHSCEI